MKFLKLFENFDVPNGWEVIDNKLVARFKFEAPDDKRQFINKVKEISDKLDHHPEVKVNGKEVKLRLWTHSEDKITKKDYELARLISKL